MVGFLYFLLIGVWIGASVGIGFWSESKGRGFSIGFFMSFIISPVVGSIVVALLEHEDPIESEYIPQRPTLTTKCPYCAEQILKEAIRCKHCHSDLTTIKA